MLRYLAFTYDCIIPTLIVKINGGGGSGDDDIKADLIHNKGNFRWVVGADLSRRLYGYCNQWRQEQHAWYWLNGKE